MRANKPSYLSLAHRRRTWVGSRELTNERALSNGSALFVCGVGGEHIDHTPQTNTWNVDLELLALDYNYWYTAAWILSGMKTRT